MNGWPLATSTFTRPYGCKHAIQWKWSVNNGDPILTDQKQSALKLWIRPLCWWPYLSETNFSKSRKWKSGFRQLMVALEWGHREPIRGWGGDAKVGRVFQFYFSLCIEQCLLNFFYTRLRVCFYWSLEREEGRERNNKSTWEENMDWLSSELTLTRDRTHNLALGLDQESNPQPLLVRDDAPSNRVTHPRRHWFTDVHP